MQSIINTLKTGTGKERLAVVSDIVSIFGVSIVTILGGAFALNAKLGIENILGLIIAGLLSLAGSLVVIALFLGATSYLQNRLLSNPNIRKLLLGALWLLFAVLCIYAAYFSYSVITSVNFVRPK